MPEEETGSGEKLFSQAELTAEVERVIGKRLERERAKFADYDDLKAKADRLDAAETSHAQQVADLNGTLAAEKHAHARLRIAVEHGLDPGDAEKFLTGDDEKAMTEQAEALAERDKRSRVESLVVPGVGRHAETSDGDGMREFTRNLFGAARQS